MNFAEGLTRDLLHGGGVDNKAFLPGGQFAIFNRAECPKRHVCYPKWGHERSKVSEDEVLGSPHI